MNSVEALRHIVEASGRPKMRISADLGRSSNWLATTLRNAQPPKAPTLAAVADACGYDLQLVRRDGGETITIDPPAGGNSR